MLLAVACGPEPLPEGDLGVAGQGWFFFCEEQRYCPGGEFPAIAVGSTFFTGFEPGPGLDNATVQAAQPALLKKLGVVHSETQFRALKSGVALLEARSRSNGLVDTLDVHLSTIDTFGFWGDSTTPPDGGAAQLTLRLDSPWALLCARPLDADGDPLGGALTWTWSSSSEQTITLKAWTSDSCQEVFPAAEGVATITAAAAGASASVTVTVTP